MKFPKRFAMTVLATGIAVWGTAQGVQYYNLTQLDKNTTTYVPDPTINHTAVINSAIFTTKVDPAIVGTGVLQPFVRIHQNPANCGQNDPCVESGYNTDGGVTPNPGSGNVNKPQFQTKDNEGHNWNQTLNLNDIGIEVIGGVAYRTFILDINERLANGNGHDEFLSLDQFRLFISDNEKLDNYTTNGTDLTSQTSHLSGGTNTYDPGTHNLSNALGTSTKIFDMDQYLGNQNPDTNGQNCPIVGQQTDTNGQQPLGNLRTVAVADGGTGVAYCDRTVGLNYALNAGSGNGIDLVVRVPDALFDPAKPFVYLFSSFGEMGKNDENNRPAPNLPTGDFSQSAGFEEWSTIKATPVAPTLALFTIGLVAMGAIRKVRFGSSNVGFGSCMPT